MRRSKGCHWPAEGRPSIYAIRHRLHNEFRTATNGPDNGDTTIGELVVELPADTGELPAIGGAQ
ncbi:hypothetical protein [Mycobacterium phage HC]|uniref:Uncharacterized protein n=2 Tax=Brujitavirus TaxID=2169611 RepID=A0A2Z5XVP5_9CAUD|nr:hypothetical protein CM06_gp43 [Mycobacterium phage Babsiella]YP_010088221.1 hypothetical protein KNT11_gp41 [Mycobacterium phage HC]AER48420.1 hypothetical protein BABSIELLA_43 [Mycobacterium phage Babsiella]BBC53915.1 hypothetical protein [Mycobacterium phage HC]